MILDKKDNLTQLCFSQEKTVSIILFTFAMNCFATHISVPPTPTNISVLRLNGTHMNISWSLIPITKARGFIQSYFILYQENDNRMRQISSVTVSATDSSVVIGELDPGKSYSVSVSASTNAGQGAFTSEVIVEGKLLLYE